MKHLVIAICDRDVETVAVVDGIEDAVAKANELLKDHCTAIRYGDAYDEFMADVRADPSENLSDPDIRLATRKNLNAWCNFHDMAWDAHIRALPDARDGEAHHGG